jgi:hypothetical protein
MMGGMSSINTTALLKGAAAMAIAAVGIFIFAKEQTYFFRKGEQDGTHKSIRRRSGTRPRYGYFLD